jgi:hypothetical protein
MNDRLLLIEKLIRKLKSGDTRSIHLDAVPGRYARLDIEEFNKIEAELSIEFLKKIFSGQNFNFQIKIEPSKYSLLPIEERKNIQKISKRLNTLYYQEQDEYAEYGTMSLGWGFPLLIIKDPSNPAKTLKAPLIIWKLDIVKTTAQSNTWTIRKTDDHEVYFNQILQSYIEQHSGDKWNDPFLSIQSDEIDLEAIQQVCDIIAETLQITPPKIQAKTIVSCSDKLAIEKLAINHAEIIPAGVLGMYKSQKQPIIQDLTNLSNISTEIAKDESQINPKETNDFLTPVVLDPSQETVLHTIHEHGKVIIQGPPGTGKSQTLTAIITNALLEKKKVLVVCEKRTALEVIKNNLKPLGLEHYIALIEDVYKDRNLIVQSIRQKLESSNSSESPFKQNQYEEVKSKYLQLRNISNQRISALFKKSFGDDNWIETAQRHHELLSKFSPLSFETLIPRSDVSEYYTQFKEWQKELEKENSALTKIQPLLEALYLKENKWWLQRNENDISAFHQFQNIALELKNHIEASSSMFGEEFTMNSSGKRFKSFVFQVFSSQQKLIRDARFKTLELYQQYHILSTQLQWKNKETVINPIYTEDFNELFKFIEEFLATSSIINQSIDQLSFIHHWINYTDRIPTQQKKLWEKLSEFPEKERLERLEEWYIRYFIEAYARENKIDWDGAQLYHDLKQYHLTINDILGQKIDDIWSKHAQNLINSSDLSTKRMLYNLRKNKQYTSRNSLRSILQSDFEFFSSVFPIMMLNPVTASSILPLQKDLYDIIILDEASQLRIEDVYSLLYRAKTHVISGDEHQMPPSSYFSADVSLSEETENIEEEKDIFLAQSSSLLEFSSDAGYFPSYLDFHYRSQHPDLIAFSNAGIYQSRLVPMPVKKSYQCMSFHAINGTYQDSVNIEEAQSIVNYLFELATENEDKMPSIGIGTLNIQQRDAIQDLIWEQAYLDPKKGKLLDLMNQSGLFIKNLENIQGDERDIILIGTTFGIDNKESFRQNFGPINRQQGYQLLNVLITRAKIAIHLFTSIPENYYRNYEEEIIKNGNTGKGLLYAYIAFVRAVSENNLDQKNYILKLLDQHSEINTKSTQHHQEQLPSFVENLIDEHLSIPMQKQVKIGGFLLEGIIQKDVKKPVYIQSEQYSYHPQVHYKHMMYKDSILKNYAIYNYKIWAYPWWSSPKNELSSVEEYILERKN